MQHLVARKLHVAFGNFHQRDAQRLDQQVVDGQLDLAAGQARIELAAQLEQLVELNVDGQIDVRHLLLGLGQAARDRLAHAAEFDHFVRDAEILRAAGSGGRRGCRLCLGGGSRRGRGSRCGDAFLCAVQIALDDTAIGASPRNHSQIDPLALRQAARQRAGLDALVAGGWRSGHGVSLRRGSGGCRSLCLGGDRIGLWRGLAAAGSRRLHILALFSDNGDDGANLDAFGTFGNEDLGDDAFIHRFKFHRRLVGFDFRQQIAGRYRIPFLYQPFGQSPFLHGRGQSGHLDRLAHAFGASSYLYGARQWLPVFTHSPDRSSERLRKGQIWPTFHRTGSLDRK